MKLISIIKNDLTNADLAVYMKDNYSHDPDSPPLPPRNTAQITSPKSDMPVLKIEFWRNEKFQKCFWFGEKIWFDKEANTDFERRGNQWLEFLEIYESF